MREVVSTILYRGGDNISPQHALVAKEAERVASIGGWFRIRHYYSGNWYEEFTIGYPDNEQ